MIRIDEVKKFRIWHCHQMLEVSAIDFERNEIKVKGEVNIVYWKRDKDIQNPFDVDSGEGTYTTREVNGTFRLDEDNLLDVSLVQFTGEYDTYGKEIFECDILAQMTHSDKIRMKPEYLKVVKFHNGGYNIKPSSWIHGVEVIGNIFQNPELVQ